MMLVVKTKAWQSSEVITLGAIAHEFSAALLQLEQLNELQRELSAMPSWNDEMALSFERSADGIIDRLSGMSQTAARTRATTKDELAAKAQIWLNWWVPDGADQVLTLAASICSDAVKLGSMAQEPLREEAFTCPG
jgi:phage-related minor tail protein